MVPPEMVFPDDMVTMNRGEANQKGCNAAKTEKGQNVQPMSWQKDGSKGGKVSCCRAVVQSKGKNGPLADIAVER